MGALKLRYCRPRSENAYNVSVCPHGEYKVHFVDRFTAIGEALYSLVAGCELRLVVLGPSYKTK
jgi:hypothetical protein